MQCNKIYAWENQDDSLKKNLYDFTVPTLKLICEKLICPIEKKISELETPSVVGSKLQPIENL